MEKTLVAMLVLMLALAACARHESKVENLTAAVEEAKKAADCTNLVTPYDFAALCNVGRNMSITDIPKQIVQSCERVITAYSDTGMESLHVLLRQFDSPEAAMYSFGTSIDRLRGEGAQVILKNDVGESSTYIEGKGQRSVFFVQQGNVVLVAIETGTPALSYACTQTNLTDIARIVAGKI